MLVRDVAYAKGIESFRVKSDGSDDIWADMGGISNPDNENNKIVKIILWPNRRSDLHIVIKDDQKSGNS